MSERRVVITGFGAVTTIGNTVEEFWNNLLSGVSGISEVKYFDINEFPFESRNAGEIKDFTLNNRFESDEAGKATQYALQAVAECLENIAIGKDFDSNRIGVAFGTTLGESQELEKMGRIWQKEGFEAPVSPKVCSSYLPCNIPHLLAREFQLYGPNCMIPNACSSGNYAVEYGYEQIKAGRVDAMLAGGSDCFNKRIYSGFARAGAVSKSFPKPFAGSRDGMIPAEGAGVLLIEELQHALKRNATIYAEVLGCGNSCDAEHITRLSPLGLARAYRAALADAGVSPEQVDFISSHGTGTKANDSAEIAAFKDVFGDRLKDIPINSIKPMLGHSMGAASSLEAIMTALSIYHKKIPPTLNTHDTDSEFGEVDVVVRQFREHEINVALESASGFGGNNGVLILGRYV